MLMNTPDYQNVVASIKAQIKTAQYRAVSHANRELILLYWNIGRVILENGEWGNKFIENLARDIKADFPSLTGFSVRNLKYMKKFAGEFPDMEFVQTLSAQISWSHTTALLDRVQDTEVQKWYAVKCIENGWSLSVLRHQIDLRLYERQALAEKTSNFEQLLPPPQSDLVRQAMKDPYIFDFIEAREDLRERDIEEALVKNITKLLLELGTGFAFLGNQYHLEVSDRDFYLDLLFYNLNLRCYVVIELKSDDFQPEYAGKLNFYLSAVDSILKKEQDNPSIGILLCTGKDKVIAEYALRDMTKPIGVSEYRLTSDLPKELAEAMPSIEDIVERVVPLKSIPEREAGGDETVSSQDPSVAALKTAQDAFAGEAERVGLKSEHDIVGLVDQERKKRP